MLRNVWWSEFCSMIRSINCLLTRRWLSADSLTIRVNLYIFLLWRRHVIGVNLGWSDISWRKVVIFWLCQRLHIGRQLLLSRLFFHVLKIFHSAWIHIVSSITLSLWNLVNNTRAWSIGLLSLRSGTGIRSVHIVIHVIEFRRFEPKVTRIWIIIIRGLSLAILSEHLHFLLATHCVQARLTKSGSGVIWSIDAGWTPIVVKSTTIFLRQRRISSILLLLHFFFIHG